MAIDASIPLRATHGGFDILDSAAKVQQLKAGNIQLADLARKQQEQAKQDQEDSVIQGALQQTQGDMGKAIDLTAGKIRPERTAELQKFNTEHTASLLTVAKAKNELEADTNSKLAALVEQARSLPPDQYASQYQNIVAAVTKLKPELTDHIDPENPIPQDHLSALQMGFITQANYHAQAVAAQSAAEEARKAALAPFQQKKAEKDANAETEVSLSMKAAAGDNQAESALQRLDQSRRSSRPVNNIVTGTDAKDIADAIENGDQPPTLQGLYRNAAPVRAELARRGVPLAKMETDWKATQKYIGTLNGSQQVRLRQAVETASESVDKISDLYQQLQKAAPTGGFKAWNKGVLATAKQLPGTAGSLATNLEAQIADLTSELGNVYMGGNSPTDHSLSLAGKNLSGDWNKQTFEDAIKQIKLNIKIRQNSISHGAPSGIGASQYFQGGQTAQAPADNSSDPFTQFGGSAKK